MVATVDLAAVQDFATALLIGALIGIEREKRKHDDATLSIGGVRTFILLAETGAIAGWLTKALASPWPLALTVLGVSLLVSAGYLRTSRARASGVGLTTEVATLVVFLMGAMTTLGYRELAIGLAVITAATLAYKQPLHGLVERLGWDDVYAVVRLLIATFIVLPLLPDRAVDPWGALNPRSLWWLVLLISSLSLVGYVATRWVGHEKGSLLTALTGGLVSSTAVTLSFARRSRDEHTGTTGSTMAAGIVIAWAVMFVRMIVEVVVVNPSLAARVAIPLGAMGAASAACAWWLFRRSRASRTKQSDEVPLKNPFSLTKAAQFALLFAVVLVLVKIVEQKLSTSGLYAVAALAGLTDVDAITLSMAKYGASGDPSVAVRSIVLAAISNTIVKCGVVVGLAGSALKRPILVAGAAIVSAGVLAMLFA